MNLGRGPALLIRALTFAWLALPALAALAQPANLGDQRLAIIDDPLRVEFRDPPADLTAEKVRQTLAVVSNVTGWKTVSQGPGAMQLTRTVNGKHVMNVEITYDAAGYDIRYVDSTELLYRLVDFSGKSVRAIHRNYNIWIRELAGAIDSGIGVAASMRVAGPPRGAAALAAAAAPVAAKAAAPLADRANEQLPLPGDYWKYSFRDERLKRRPEHFTVEVASVSGWTVSDALDREKAEGGPLRREVPADAFAFVGRRLSKDYFTLELAPYYAASGQLDAVRMGQVPAKGPDGWKTRVMTIGRDRVQVPAGFFDATRIEIDSEPRNATFGSLAVRRHRYTFWYAPEAKRYVMMRHQAWNGSGATAADEIVRLEEFRLK
jgi:hypothetical protein